VTPPSPPPETGEGVVSPRENAITPMRLGLAMLVIFSHAYPVGGFGRDGLFELTGQMQLGTVAVIGFFGLSGFLLAQSRISSSLGRYVLRRALRILPGLWVCIVLIGLCAVPLAVALGGRASLDEVARFVGSAATFQPLPVDIPGLYAGTGVPFIVDAPLWTLPWEVYLYAVLALVGIGGPRLMRTACLALLIVASILNWAMQGTALELYGQLPVAFLAGSCLYLQTVPLRRDIAAAGLLATVVAAILGHLALVGPITIAYLALYFGMRLPLRWTFDLSFGVYIYGWPVQSLLTEVGAASLGLVPYVALTLLLVIPIAALSARFVEMPALRLRARAREPIGRGATPLGQQPTDPGPLPMSSDSWSESSVTATSSTS
jgi:peptidoglycan/LPS O-acetylase OafA/YrhL